MSPAAAHPLPVNPLSVTDAEEPYLGRTPSQLVAVGEQLLGDGVPSATALGLVGWLQLKSSGVDPTSNKTRAKYRRILREHQPMIPPPTRDERRLVAQRGSADLGVVAGGGAGVAAVAGLVAHSPLPLVGAAALGLLYITAPEGDALDGGAKAPVSGGVRSIPYTPREHPAAERCLPAPHLLSELQPAA